MLNTADVMKTCKNMKKMIKTQVLETLKWKCKRERLEKREDHEIFILVHLTLSYIQFVKTTWAWLCTISKDLQSIHPYTFKICKNTTKDSWITQESHQHSRTLLQTWKTTRHTHKAWERSNLSGNTTQPTINHFLQASNQAKSSKNWSKINLQLLQNYMITKERVSTRLLNKFAL